MLYEVLKLIQSRPNMYFDRPSVRQINAFILGFTMARRINDLPEDNEEKEFEGFRDWVAERFEIDSTHSWAQIIDFFSTSDSNSVELFFELLLEYKKVDSN